nr:immunoglobulin light chain junction region [Macaca mulatta]MOV79517.1 immunoglobulin light chain junction region [Macaca mulatta]MOV79689.1 immunoglobulin light chain junction region [Macaca mulatta]MOV80470.1 immunoglobulin light chain junction region [Macaca mulatta]MOV82320.1 immunoglobulin light chain junction region [Macaca mulatta]
CQQVYSSPFTF